MSVVAPSLCLSIASDVTASLHSGWRQVFNEFDLEHHQECTYDHVAVYDGDSENATLLGT